jgi:hypothetical protein
MSAVSRSTVAGSIDLKRDAVRGLGASTFFFLGLAFFFGASRAARDVDDLAGGGIDLEGVHVLRIDGRQLGALRLGRGASASGSSATGSSSVT